MIKKLDPGYLKLVTELNFGSSCTVIDQTHTAAGCNTEFSNKIDQEFKHYQCMAVELMSMWTKSVV